ncbi:hypothetical protein ACFIU5_02445 [Oenococcus oeni]|uniref:hypothetical protein n=1 Tax=Oenococcus oeni TaxID=1247 RepID=UPI001EFA0255|nr:hypothetical protein [Oenococcus oeni]
MSDTDVLTAKNDTEKEVANDLYQALVNKRPLKVTEYEKKLPSSTRLHRVKKRTPWRLQGQFNVRTDTTNV